MECARYGETDAVRAILEIHNNTTTTTSSGENNTLMIDITDSGKNTPLHKAAANGHLNTVSLLLCRGAKHIPNENGATPLHWAAGAGKSGVCKLLLDHFDALSKVSSSSSSGDDCGDNIKPLDVLLKNSFGRSALTEAFTSGDTETVGVLLNHDSAEEEKLIGGMKKEEVDANQVDGDEGDKRKEEIVHEFDFRKGLDEEEGAHYEEKSVFIRELVSAHLSHVFFLFNLNM